MLLALLFSAAVLRFFAQYTFSLTTCLRERTCTLGASFSRLTAQHRQCRGGPSAASTSTAVAAVAAVAAAVAAGVVVDAIDTPAVTLIVKVGVIVEVVLVVAAEFALLAAVGVCVGVVVGVGACVMPVVVIVEPAASEVVAKAPGWARTLEARAFGVDAGRFDGVTVVDPTRVLLLLEPRPLRSARAMRETEDAGTMRRCGDAGGERSVLRADSEAEGVSERGVREADAG